MLSYRKENGFPVNLSVETVPHTDEKESWTGFKSVITVEDCQVDEIYHKVWHDRVLWVNGFFKGLEYKAPENDWIENYSGAQM